MIVWAARKFGWPPSVTRQQSYRDLQLLLESYRTLAPDLEV